MSEILNECDVHPSEDKSFRSAVLKTLIARQILAIHLPDNSFNPAKAPTEFITAFGIDVAFSELVNDCATRIADGTCGKYTLQTNGINVSVNSRIQQ